MAFLTTISQQNFTTKLSPAKHHAHMDMNQVVTVILGGGEGKRLAPLTNTRCKPAICFGGKYLLIDIPISNAINSGCQKIFLITQFLSATLHQHIYRTYRPGIFSSGFVELLSAEQRPGHQSWFQGTADAVRQNLKYLLDVPGEYFLILSGDQLYNMDFQEMFKFAQHTDADMVVAALPVNVSEAKRMGLLKLNEDRYITEFCEKPQDKAVLEHMRLQGFTSKQHGKNYSGRRNKYLGSMGIYLFKRKALFDLLLNDSRDDFGKHLIPAMVEKGNAAAYLYDGYWEDIGTIESFYKANIALTEPNPSFNCYDERNPILSHQQHLPSPKITNTLINHSIICEGSISLAEEITNSILGPRSVIKQGTVIRNSYVMGNDFYSHPAQSHNTPQSLEIGENCLISRAIIDKNASIGNNVQLTNKNKLVSYKSEHLHIQDGIIVVTRGACIPDGYCL